MMYNISIRMKGRHIMKVKDIIKENSWILNKINGEAEFVIAEGNENVSRLSDMVIRSTAKAVLLATSEGELWLPLSTINFTHTGGRQYYNRETGRYSYEEQWVHKNDEAIFLLKK